jgi:hypothetical protein
MAVASAMPGVEKRGSTPRSKRVRASEVRPSFCPVRAIAPGSK